MKARALLIAIPFCCGFVLAEDKLTLKDGQVVTGDIVSESETVVQIDTGEETIKVPSWAIEKTERDDSGPVPGKETRAANRSRAKEYESTPELVSWIKVCIENLGSHDEGVRATAIAALRAAGPAAHSGLEAAAQGKNPTVAARAKTLLEQGDRLNKGRDIRGRAVMTREQRLARATESLGKTLGLREEQQPKFAEILGEFRDKQGEITKNARKGGRSRDEIAKELAALREEENKKLSTVLDEDQMKTYLSLGSGRSGEDGD